MWAEYDLHRERKVERVRADTIGLFQAAVGAIGGDKGVAQLNKWLEGLG